MSNKLGSLSVSGTGKLDLKDNDLVVDSGGVAPVRAAIQSAYTGGTWSGDGITTSAPLVVDGRSVGLGYAAGDDPAVAGLGNSLSGQSFASDAATALVKYTYYGDADLDGDVDGVDVGAWSGNFTGSGGSSSKLWTEGDWDYDGDVDGVDVGFWSGNFTGSGGGVLGPAVDGVSAIPEPSSFALLALAGATLLRRRARRACN